MPNITCPQRITCDCQDSPVTNYSSERPDVATFIGVFRFIGIPPLGVTYSQLACQAICESTISQEDADLCAQEMAKLCVMDTDNPWQNPGGGNTQLFVNDAQTVTINCANNQICGSCGGAQTFTWNFPAGKIVAPSKNLANQQAYSTAYNEAVAHKICFSTSALDAVCANEGALFQISASGGTKWPWAQVAFCSGDSNYVPFTDVPYKWELIGGSLPAGLTLGACTGIISGTPTASGSYSFTIKITDYTGSYQTRTFTLCVVGLSNAEDLPDATLNQSYSEQLDVDPGDADVGTFSIIDGALPPGLSLSNDGLISGTPDPGTEGEWTFVVQFTAGSVCP